MQRVTLTLELVTPAFLGGGDRRLAAAWRAASVRGELRWWLRAVAWRAFGGNLDIVRDVEAAIFGNTDRASNLQRLAALLTRVEPYEGFLLPS